MTLDIRTLPGVVPSIVQVPGAICLICGANAAGKTRLLNAIASSLETGDQSIVALNGPSLPSSVEMIDTFLLLQRQRISFGQDAELMERVGQAGLTAMRAADVRLASYMLGRSYDWIEVAEIDATDDAELLSLVDSGSSSPAAFRFAPEVVPFFRVSVAGAEFDSRALSQGELAGLTLLWSLARHQDQAVICIEEPETFLSPQSAQRCLDVLAVFADRKGSIYFVNSHSYLGLSMAPPDHLLLLEPVSPGMVSGSAGTQGRLWSTLRVSPPKPIIFVVEDEAGAQWTGSLLARADFENRDLVGILIGGGVDPVRNAAKFPSDAQGSAIAVWGVLDGDERNRRIRGWSGNLLFLPGDSSPEKVLLNALEIDGLSLSGVDVAAARASSAAHAGDDPHDQVIAIAQDLGLTVPVLRQAVWLAWLDQTEEGRRFEAEFRSALELVTLPRLFGTT